MREFTLGSLFDGSGGFPLAGALCGIRPVWASEVEPYPIAVTRSRFPDMKHLGSVTDICGSEVEPVDIITFGSPCQDLSIAGKRAGLKHEVNGDDETTRSGLFMEAIRIIKEMRESTNGEYPKYALWENVPGAFSSNKGEDFRIVLEELIKIVEPSAVMPPVPQRGWAYADSYVGDGWSLAYRVFDAQYWGVPQRRRRIHLVLDLTGGCARKILFEQEGLRGHFETFRTAWQETPGDVGDSVETADREGAVGVIPINTMIATRHKQLGRGTGFGVGEVGDPQFTISAGHEHAVAYTVKTPSGAVGFDGYNSDVTGDVSATLGVNCGMSTGRNGVVVPYTLKIRSGCEGGGKGALIQEDMSATLSTLNDQYLFQPVVFESGIAARVDGRSVMSAGFKELNSAKARSDAYGYEIAPCLSANKHDASVCIKTQHLFENHSQDSRYKGPLEVCPMLPAQLGTGGNNQPFVVHETYSIQGNTIDRDAKQNGGGVSENVAHTLNSVDRHGVAFAMQGFGDYKESNAASGLKARDYKDATDLVVQEEPIAIDRAFFNQGQNALYDPQCYTDGTVPTLVARGPSGVCHCNNSRKNGVMIRYIVRRLTPTECARLQGFADRWGDIDLKNDFTDEEYQFWLKVRNEHAAINGKAVKDYTKKQMLTWYNKLRTDSAEYKLWGNGIALPPALYCMQGIVDALKES